MSWSEDAAAGGQQDTQSEISTRHLSFLETGRSRPSRARLLRLAEQLEGAAARA